jgi:hypothetical protein
MASGRSGRHSGPWERAIIEHRSTVESELGGRVAMEAGPRDTEQQRRDAADGASGLSPDGPDEQDVLADEVEVELRPQRRLRIWQLAPIVVLAAVGSLMFAFPLAFGTGDGGAVVAMLGLLLSCCAAGWGVMAARRVGHTWPGLPSRGSGERPDWRVIALYVGVAAVLVALAVWRVARLR